MLWSSFQYGPGTASLNVATATAIVLNQFAVWAQYSERPRDGFKYIVDEPKPKMHRGGIRRMSRVDDPDTDDVGAAAAPLSLFDSPDEDEASMHADDSSGGGWRFPS